MLSFTELREQLGITTRKLSQLVRDGMPHTMDGRRKMFDEDAVVQWLLDTGRAEIKEDPPASRIARTRAECGQHFGVSVDSVAKWHHDPTFPGRPGNRGQRDGYYPLEEIEQWLAARPGGAGGADPLGLRQQLLAVRLRREQRQDAVEAGEVASLDAIVSSLTRQIHTAKKVLESLPDRAARELPADLPAAVRSAVICRWRDGVYEAEQILSEVLADEDRDDDE